jgi:hypothetical protein
MKYTIIAFAISVLMFSFSNSFGQATSEKSIKTGLGFGMQNSYQTSGFGWAYSFGYQQYIWNDRFRFNPNLGMGQYNSKFLPLDARDQFFNSMNLEAKLFFDVSKNECFALVVGCGGLVNYTTGMLGLGGDPDSYTENLSAKYVRGFHVGVYLGAGFRINPPNKRTAINLMPFNINIGTNDYVEFTPKIELEIKLR